MKNLMMGLLLLAVAGTASAQGNSRNAAGAILGGDNRGGYESRGNDGYGRDRNDRDRYDRDRNDRSDKRDCDRKNSGYGKGGAYNNKGSYGSNASYSERDRYEREVQALNRSYDERADYVRRDNRLRARDRRDALAAIERERQQRLRDLNDRYYANGRGNTANGGYYRGY
ncbi:hypothetical protein EPD60_10655 [Flaviaesturariibacter flavus]|uniref:Uncharacterized protein n=1 Tax=Flaviaesturariibacter flavus TaxID=2502780 RepID=A0A4V2NVQ9_9BACT|nr:hypothetical protein [Flaviaesturariibacter flavus]TCJ14442.1 hypothetical protein EPD60_10655 [Flaviaesturariibacter flavus]